MPKTYTLDFRIQVLKSLDRGNSYDEVCKFFSISLATLYRWIRLKNKKGEPQCNPREIYKEQKLPKDELLVALEKTPDATLLELAQQFNCSAPAVYYRLKKFGITRKKNHPLRRAQ